MDTLSFLKAILPPLEYKGDQTYIYCKGYNNRSGRMQLQNLLAASIEEMSVRLLEEPDHHAFHSLASYENAISGTEKRTKLLSANLYTLAFDIDINPEKGDKCYTDKEEALYECSDVLADLGITEYIVVNSGNGWHFYILLDKVLFKDDWEAASRQLSRYLSYKSIKYDKSKICDSSMILRTPGSFNVKKHPLKVEIYKSTEVRHNLDKIIADITNQVPEDYGLNLLAMNTTATLGPVPDGVGGDGEYDQIETKCKQIKEMLINASVPERHWYNILGVAAYCKDSQTAAIRWSEKYSKFNQVETVGKMLQWRRKATGPTTCSALELSNPGGCSGCVLMGSVNTPAAIKAPVTYDIIIDLPTGVEESIKAAKIEDTLDPDTDELIIAKNPKIVLTEEEKIEKVVIPAGYYWEKDDNGRLGVFRKGINGEPVKIMDYVLYVADHAISDNGGNPTTIAVLKYARPHEKELRELRVPPLQIQGRGDKLLDTLSTGGVIFSPNKFKAVHLYLQKCYGEVQERNLPKKLIRNFGWTPSDTFIVGLNEITPLATIPAVSENGSLTQLANYMRPKGSLEKWVDGTKAFGYEGVELSAFLLLCGFASPLFHFTQLGGVVVSAYSAETGTGKSTSVNYGMSVWGDPKQLAMQPASTANSIYKQCSILKNIPVVVDEATSWDCEKASDMCYLISQGKEKGRLDQKAEMQTQAEWSNILMLTTNSSFYDKIDTFTQTGVAQKQRIFELTIPHTNVMAKLGESLNTEFLGDNFGLAGPVFMQHLVAMGSEKIKELVRTCKTDYQTEFNMRFSGDERFMGALISLAWVSGKIAKQMNLIDDSIDLARVFKRINEVLLEKRIALIDSFMTGPDALQHCVQTNQNKFAIVSNYDDKTDSHGAAPDIEVIGRIELYWNSKDSKTPYAGSICMSETAFREYCVDNGGAVGTYTKDLQSSVECKYQRKKVFLTSGINETFLHRQVMHMNSVMCHIISLSPEVLKLYHPKAFKFL